MARPRPTKQVPRPAEPAAPAGPLPVAALALLAVLVAASLLLFYLNAATQVRQMRVDCLAFLVAPDSLLELWCGGKYANFSFFDRWPILLVTGAILGGAWLAGQLALASIGVAAVLDRLERSVFGLAVGLNVLSLYALAVGLAGLLQQRWVFVTPLMLLAAGFGWLMLRRDRQGPLAGQVEVPHGGRDLRGANDPRWRWLLVGALPFAAVIVLSGMLPPWAYDVREYHLQAPKEWFQKGRIDFLPHNIYANMPLGSELNSVWAMSLIGGESGWWWGALTGKTVMACYSLVSAAALVAIGRRVHSLAAGCIAAAVFLATPWVGSLAGHGYNEGPVMLYALLAIYALWLAGRPEFTAQASRLHVLAGFLAGSAVACKYPPVLFLVLPLVAWIVAANVLRPPRRWRLAALHGFLFLVAVAAGCGLWLGKNLVQTGNPTYPLLYAAFDGRTRTPAKDRQWTRAHSPPGNTWRERLSPLDFLGQLAWIGWRMPWASSILVPLALVAFLAPRRTRGLVAALGLWMLYVFCAWWLVTHRLDRFLLLMLPAAALLAGIGAAAVEHPLWRRATLAIVILGMVTLFPLVAVPMDNRFFAPLAALRRDDSDLESGGDRLHSAQRWLNEHAAPGERVLLVGDAEPFELTIGAVYNTCFDDCQFARLFQGRTREERLAALRREGIRYVLFNWNHLARYRRPGNYGYTSDYVTPELVHRELVGEQRLLRRIAIGTPTELAELYEVVP